MKRLQFYLLVDGTALYTRAESTTHSTRPLWWTFCATILEAKNKAGKIRGVPKEKSVECQSEEFIHDLEGNGEPWKDYE